METLIISLQWPNEADADEATYRELIEIEEHTIRVAKGCDGIWVGHEWTPEGLTIWFDAPDGWKLAQAIVRSATGRDMALLGQAIITSEASGFRSRRLQLPDLTETEAPQQGTLPSPGGWRRVSPSRHRNRPGDVIALHFGAQWVFGRYLAQVPEGAMKGLWVFVGYDATSSRRDPIPDLDRAGVIFGPALTFGRMCAEGLGARVGNIAPGNLASDPAGFTFERTTLEPFGRSGPNDPRRRDFVLDTIVYSELAVGLPMADHLGSDIREWVWDATGTDWLPVRALFRTLNLIPESSVVRALERGCEAGELDVDGSGAWPTRRVRRSFPWFDDEMRG